MVVVDYKAVTIFLLTFADEEEEQKEITSLVPPRIYDWDIHLLCKKYIGTRHGTIVVRSTCQLKIFGLLGRSVPQCLLLCIVITSDRKRKGLIRIRHGTYIVRSFL